jgi:hypothetical protein
VLEPAGLAAVGDLAPDAPVFRAGIDGAVAEVVRGSGVA